MQGHVVVFLILWLSACGYAGLRGGAPERIVGLTFFAGALLSQAVAIAGTQTLRQLDIGILMVDGGMFAVILAVALVSTRYWPVAMASAQGAQLLAHIAKLAGSDVIPVAYFILLVALSFPMLVMLAIATRRHRLRLARYRHDYAWVWQLPPAYRQGHKVDEARSLDAARPAAHSDSQALF